MQRIWIVAAVVCLTLSGCQGGAAAPAPSAQPAPRPSFPVDGTILNAKTGRPLARVRVDGPITAAVSDGHGGWYIGGGFTTVDGHRWVGLARITANGSLDTAWHPRPLKPPRMRLWVSLAKAGDRVFVAGGFQVPPHGHMGGALALNAATGSLDRNWQAPNECSDGDWEIRVAAGRAWIATACAAAPCLFAVDADSAHALAWDAHIAAIGEIACLDDMAVAGGEVYFTGGFRAVGGRPRNGIAAAAVADGALDTAFAPRGGCATDGHALALSGHLVYVGGDGCPVAALDATTGKQVWAWPRKGNNITAALLATPTRVYVGGELGTIAGVVANGLLALNARTGVAEPSWHPPAGSEVFAIVQSGGRILIGGQ
jgi:hypothetical protein